MIKRKKDNAKQVRSKLSSAIEALDLGIRKCLLHRHLSQWRPISTAPHNQALEIGVLDENSLDENSLIEPPFPCRRNNASEWINSDLGTRVYVQPVRWRIWQKAPA
jgi:hypothetical protein